MTKKIPEAAKAAIAAITGHRPLYMALSALHAAAGVAYAHPEIYGPMALIYFVLALRG